MKIGLLRSYRTHPFARRAATFALATGLLVTTASMFMSVPLAGAVNTVTLYVSTSGTNNTECTAAKVCASVQEGIDAANTYANTSIILEVAAGMYVENDTVGVLPVSDTLTIQGAGASTTAVSGAHSTAASVISSQGASLTIDGLSIIDGSTTSEPNSGAGGGVLVTSGAVTLSNDSISNDTAGIGGGLDNVGGDVALINDTFSADTATGVFGYGGGVYSQNPISLINDTFTNDAAIHGGAFESTGGATLTNDTFFGDTASISGDAIYNQAGITTVANSILDETSSCKNENAATGRIVDGGYNVESDNTCGFGPSGIVNSASINLAGALAANGSSGPETFSIGPTSSAYEEVPALNCTVASDERGNRRPGDLSPNCDAGAFEFEKFLNQAPLTLTSTNGTNGTPLTLTTSGGSGGGTLSYLVADGTATGCEMNGGGTALSVSSVGTCVVTATKAGDTTYWPVSALPASVNFTNAPQAPLTLTSVSGSYGTALTLTTSGGSDGAALSYFVTDGTATGCAMNGAGTTLSVSSAGTCVVTATMAGNAIYFSVSSPPTTVTFAKANQAPLTLTSVSGSYGAALTLTTSGGSDSGALSYSASDGTATGCAIDSADTNLSATSAGTCVVTTSESGNTNYLPISSSPTTITFALADQAPLTLTSTSGTYGTAMTLTTSGGSVTGQVRYRVIHGTATGCAINSAETNLSATSAGTCVVTASDAGNSNYLPVSSLPTTVTFNRAHPTEPAVSNLPASAVAGGSFGALVVSNGDGEMSVGSLTANVCTVSGITINFVGEGTCIVVARIGTGTNYLSATGTAQSFTVAPKATPTTTTLPSSPTTGVTTTTPDGSSTTTVPTTTSTSPTSTTPSTGSLAPAVVQIAFCGPPGASILNCQISIQAQGFKPGSIVLIVVHSTPRVIGSSTVGSDGTANLAAGLPSNLSPGVHHVDVTATNADGSAFFKSEVFTVIAGQRIGSIGFVPPGPLAGDVQFVPSDHRGLVLVTTAGAIVVLAALGSSMGGESRGGVRASGGGNLEVVELEREEVELGEVGLAEEEVKRRSRLRRRTGTRLVDRFSKYFPRRAAAVSPVVGRLIVDGDYLRASLGSAWLLLCLAAVGFGAFASASTGWYAVPPSLGIFLTILGLSIFDASLGMLAGASFFIGATVAGHMTSANELRLSFGLVLIWFAIPLAAASLRPLRRKIRLDVDSVWERVADFAIGGLFAAWAAMKMTEALSGLAGVELPIAKDVNLVALAVLGFIGLRITAETFVAHTFADRMEIVHHEGSLDSGRVQIGVSLVVQIALFIFIAIAFLGSNWALYVGAVVFFAPLAALLFSDSIPKSHWVTKWKPTGLVMWTIVIVAGILLSRVLNHAVSSSHLVEEIGFVVLPIPVLIFWTLELFEFADDSENGVDEGWGVLYPQIAGGGDSGPRNDESFSNGRREQSPSLRKWAVRFAGVALLTLSATLVLTHVASS